MKKTIAILLLLASCNGAYVCANSDIAANQPSSISPDYLIYQSNPWLYMEKMLVCGKVENKEIISLKACVILAAVIVVLGLKSNLNGDDISLAMTALAAWGLSAVFIVSFVCGIISAIRRSDESHDVEILKNFIKNYDQNLVPNELRQVCKALAERYVSHGDEYLKNKGIEVLALLRELVNEKKNHPLCAMGDQPAPLLMYRWPDDVQK